MAEELVQEKNLVSSGRDLKVYRIAFEVAVQIHQKTLNFPKIEQYALASQMRRCSQSICANIVEGFAKQSFSSAEFGGFIGIALGSAEEMQVWIEFALRFNYISAEESEAWLDQYDHIARMLRNLRNKVVS